MNQEPKSVPAVVQEVELMDKAIARLSEISSSLDRRLALVLHSELPKAECDKQPMPPTPCKPAVCQMFSDRTETINNISSNIESVLRRVAV